MVKKTREMKMEVKMRMKMKMETKTKAKRETRDYTLITCLFSQLRISSYFVSAPPLLNNLEHSPRTILSSAFD